MKFTLDWDIIKAILLNSNSKNFQLKKLPTQKTSNSKNFQLKKLCIWKFMVKLRKYEYIQLISS
jgi:hypothetical protein